MIWEQGRIYPKYRGNSIKNKLEVSPLISGKWPNFKGSLANVQGRFWLFCKEVRVSFVTHPLVSRGLIFKGGGIGRKIA